MNVFLLALVVGCALLLVRTQYQSRTLFIDLERAQYETRQLEMQWTQLQLDQSILSKHTRVEVNAKRDLGMVLTTAARTEYVTVGVP